MWRISLGFIFLISLLEVACTEVISWTLEYKDKGTVLKGMVSWDDSIETKRPGVLVVHEWWGHNAYAQKRAKMLAELGYVAFALDMYGEGKLAEHPKDAESFMNEALKDIRVAESRFSKALEVLRQHPKVLKDKIAAIGYCFGGGVVLHAARKGFNLKGVASFHGSLAGMIKAKKGVVKSAVLICNGGADPMISQKDVEGFRAEMKGAEVDFKIETYPGVLHSFTNPIATKIGEKFNLPLKYDAAADQRSWASLEVFLQRVFK